MFLGGVLRLGVGLVDELHIPFDFMSYTSSIVMLSHDGACHVLMVRVQFIPITQAHK